MSLHFTTQDPALLLKLFNDAIAQREAKGKITTWEKIRHADRDYYTHKADEWKRKAFFLYNLEANRLTFTVVKPKGGSVTQLVYAYYHGHLIETFINHFGRSFSMASATSAAANGDQT